MRRCPAGSVTVQKNKLNGYFPGEEVVDGFRYRCRDVETGIQAQIEGRTIRFDTRCYFWRNLTIIFVEVLEFDFSFLH